MLNAVHRAKTLTYSIHIAQMVRGIWEGCRRCRRYTHEIRTAWGDKNTEGKTVILVPKERDVILIPVCLSQ